MIQEIRQEDILQSVEVIRKSFATVANEFGITEENGARFTAFATDEERINWHNKIGYSLLEHSFERAKELGCTKMNIGIVEENIVLRSWYEKYGFVHTGTEKFDFFPFTCGYMEKDL